MRCRNEMMQSPIQLDQEDANDDATVNEGIVEEGNCVITKVGTIGTVATSVKMKLNTLCTSKQVMSRLQSLTMTANILLGEAYLFANFHVLRLHDIGAEIPVIDDKFYWRSMMAVTINKHIDRLFTPEWTASIEAYDALRPVGDTKVDIGGNFNAIAGSLMISMKTAAINHLWLNLDKRVKRFVSWRWPELKRCAKKVQHAVTIANKVPAQTLFPGTTQKDVLARDVINKLRLKLPDVSRFGSRAHKTMSMYFYILEETERELELRNETDVENIEKATEETRIQKPNTKTARKVNHVKKTKKSQEVQHLPNTKKRNEKKAARKVKHAQNVKIKNTGNIQKNRKRFNGRTFSILPLKGGYTLSNIPVSTMAFMQVLRDCCLVKYSGTNGAMKLDHAMLWAKFFNLKKVETKTRRFAGVICTDGCAVSVLLTRTETDYVGLGILSPSELRLVLSDPNSLVVGVDPGITDVATFAASDGTFGSYSGRRYYEDAKFNLSARRINNWNKETYEVTRFIPTPKTSSFIKLQVHVKAYLASFQTLLQHRASTGYRNMRFMRYVFKKKTVTKICDMIAPRDKFVIVGFGDWRGPNGTPISRKCVGPLQDIRRELKSRNNVAMHEVNEAYSSQRCSSCHCDTVNMTGMGEGKTTKIHKVLHCTQSSKDGTLQGIRCGKTFDRDFNASQNMLYLTRCFIKGWPRPERFQRPTAVVAPKKRQVRSKPS